ncbi:hypothetical protein MMIC_P1454 [Mariprofundus micogutta]|uniref:Nitrogen regulatory protein P-II n=1 Tax=Mariprofundus micogutta TaxID=1921010 RepID=A0A1L8CNK6_9PROT|nr:hypothetical protein [Mariprofundus micogutta]GAV20487.1 hypothetical protein MMIC_P1454 [Mariprofundus micogutta]
MKTANKLITCIVPEGLGKPAIKALYETYGTASADFHVASGIGKSAMYSEHSLGQRTEKDIITVMVSLEQAEDVFAFLYQQTNINRPHGGIIYMNDLSHASDYSVPEIAGD